MLFKFALLTCLVYLCLSGILQGILMFFANKQDMIVGVTGWRLGVLFGAFWVIAFLVASHFVFRITPR